MLSSQTVQEIANYLSNCPYKEVAGIINKISAEVAQAQASNTEPKKDDKKDK